MSRKIYLMNEESLVQFFKRPTRFLKENTTRKESVFEKPYADEDYRKMHFNFPIPDWPPFPGVPPFPPLPPIVPPGPLVGVCAITCYEPLSDCDEPVWCHPSIWTGQDPSCNACTWIVEGATSGYNWHHYIGDEPSKIRGIDIWIDKDLLVEGEALIHVQMRDAAGNLCGEDLEVTCKVCPPDVSISWDTGAETIGQNDTLIVSVKDGLGPYTWNVTGTGFSMLHSTTAGGSNTLQSDGSACGTAEITVTDDCDETTTGYVRCTAISSWVKKGGVTADYDAGITWCYGASYQYGDTELINGNERWTFLSFGVNCMTAAPNDSWVPDSGTFVDPPCGKPFDCSPSQGLACSGTNPAGCTGYLQMTSCSYYQWECN